MGEIAAGAVLCNGLFFAGYFVVLRTAGAEWMDVSRAGRQEDCKMIKKIGMAMVSVGALVAMAAVGCGGTNVEGGNGGGGNGGGGNGGSAGSGGSGGLQWYTTCGDPVCMDPDGGSSIPPGATLCTTEMVGAACTTAGATCWPADSQCGVQLICAASDPKLPPNSCPISRVSYKKNIDYLSEADVASIAEEATTMRLSSWNYKTESGSSRRHVGFLIDDMPESVAVAASGEQVDLYGYTSMAIAAVQVQDKRLKALEKELASMRSEMMRLRGEADKCAGSQTVKSER